MSMETLRAELLGDIEAYTAEVLREVGVGMAVAEQAGCALADRLAERFGGLVFSMPKDHAYRLSQREREIVDARREGESVAVLARRYDMSESGIRKLLRRAKRRDVVDSQLPLFGQETQTAQNAPQGPARPAGL